MSEPTRISSNDVRLELATVLDNAEHHRKPTIITRYNLPVAVVVPYDEWLASQGRSRLVDSPAPYGDA